MKITRKDGSVTHADLAELKQVPECDDVLELTHGNGEFSEIYVNEIVRIEDSTCDRSIYEG